MYQSELNPNPIYLSNSVELGPTNKINNNDYSACNKSTEKDKNHNDINLDISIQNINQDLNEMKIDNDNVSNASPSRSTLVSIPFWSQDPNILFNANYALEFFPSDNMTYNQKLNAITRTVLIMGLITYVYTRKIRIIIISILTILAIFGMHYFEKNKIHSKTHEEFTGTGFFKQDGNMPPLGNYYQTADENTGFQQPDATNPFGNVLLTDYDFNPNKKSAIPMSKKESDDIILNQAKQLVINANPGQPDIANKLFHDLGDQLTFEQSMQPFYSNPATTIPNDQGRFAAFCYGNMISAKEGNMQALERSIPPRHTMY